MLRGRRSEGEVLDSVLEGVPVSEEGLVTLRGARIKTERYGSR
ncbi:MAG TPA: hypothetical protein VG034_26245 [Acidimicrobiia bacterium]|jgi:hypothetical protein|nr:hypothetical protein [Acidimicrobiia bacterium]